jgi:alpha-glucosidase (family GH31 glycosyl hydrolase)
MMMNLRWMTFCPGYAVGIGLWNLDSAQESEAKAILAWREKYQPYFLQQIIKTRQTGYPHAMTPIHIAFPKWDSAHTMATIKARKWAWMVGTKLLVMTLAGQDYESVNTREFMLPPGKWKSEATGQVLTGGAIITVKHWMDGLFWKVEPSIRRQRVKFYK